MWGDGERIYSWDWLRDSEGKQITNHLPQWFILLTRLFYIIVSQLTSQFGFISQSKWNYLCEQVISGSPLVNLTGNQVMGLLFFLPDISWTGGKPTPWENIGLQNRNPILSGMFSNLRRPMWGPILCVRVWSFNNWRHSLNNSGRYSLCLFFSPLRSIQILEYTITDIQGLV